jgi:hypothetical protein
MKTILAIAAVILMYGCYSFKESQVQMVNAELVKIDTIYRYEKHQQVLTWKTDRNIEYVSYAAMGPVFTVGSRVTVFVTR